MKARLLKKIRTDKRFDVYLGMNVDGFKHSGWWYCEDKLLKKKIKHKRLRNVLDWLCNIYRWQFYFKLIIWSISILAIGILILYLKYPFP